MRRLRVAFATCTMLAALAPAARAQGTTPGGFRGEFLEQFNTSMGKLVMLAEAVPADKYTFRAQPGVMPIGQIFAHIARFNYHYPATAMGIAAPAGINPDTLEQIQGDKAQVVALLRRSAEHVRQAMRQMPEEQLARTTTLYGRQVPQWSVLLQLIAHMNDHMGQSIAYSRMAGTAPPWSQ